MYFVVYRQAFYYCQVLLLDTSLSTTLYTQRGTGMGRLLTKGAGPAPATGRQVLGVAEVRGQACLWLRNSPDPES